VSAISDRLTGPPKHVVIEDEPAHSELPPSSADKWFHCHAWRRLTAGLPDESSAAAEEGTFAHDCYAKHLEGTEELESSCQTQEMFDHLQTCVDWVKDQEGDLLIERRVDFGSGFGYVGLTGTADNILVHPDHLTIADLKYGRGVVEVADNLQLMVYLVGAVEEFGPRPNYRLVILQPRPYHKDGPIREHWVTHAQFIEFRTALEKAIEQNYNPKAQATVGEHCRKWCNALGSCRAAAKYSLDLFRSNPLEDHDE
jgi:hypothetical protein